MFKRKKKEVEEPQEKERQEEVKEDEGEQEVKPPFEWRPLFLLVGGLFVLILWGIYQTSGQNPALWIAGFLGFLMLGRVFWPVIKLINDFRKFMFVGVGVILILIGFIIMKFFGYLFLWTAEDNPILATLWFLLSISFAFLFKKWTKKPDDENSLSFWWVALTNTGYVLFAGMFCQVLPHYVGGFFLSFVLTLLFFLLIKKVSRLSRTVQKRKDKATMYLGSAVFSTLISFALFMLFVPEYVPTNLLQIYATVSGCVMGGWITFMAIISRGLRRELDLNR